MAPDPSNLDDPFDTSDELMAEAAAMEARAARRRQDSIDEVHRQVTPMTIQHNTDARAVKLAEQEATLARADAKLARGKAIKGVDEADRMLQQADTLEAAGDLAGASELREEAAGSAEANQRLVAQAEASEAAAVAAEERAKVHAANIQTLDDDATVVLEHSAAVERANDQMEESAGMMRTAGTQMTEAERLEAAAIDLRSRGVEGVERVDAAAKTARDEAEVQSLRARQHDPSHTFGTTDDFGVDQNLIEIEPNTPDEPAATDEPTEPGTGTPTDDNSIDPNLIEIEPNTPESPTSSDDLGTDPNLIEIEPNAAADVGGDEGFTDDAAATGDGFGADGFGADGFGADGFGDQGFEEPAEVSQDFAMETFDGEGDDSGSDFASADDSAGGFDSTGENGFDTDFEA